MDLVTAGGMHHKGGFDAEADALLATIWVLLAVCASLSIVCTKLQHLLLCIPAGRGVL